MTKFEQIIYNKYINEDFVSDYIMYVYFDKELNEQFIDEQIEKFNTIKKNYITTRKTDVKNQNILNNEPVIRMLDALLKFLQYIKYTPVTNIKINQSTLYSILGVNNDILIDLILEKYNYYSSLQDDNEKFIKEYNKLSDKILSILSIFEEVDGIKSIIVDYESIIETLNNDNNIDNSALLIINKIKKTIEKSYIKVIESGYHEITHDPLEQHSIVTFGDNKLTNSIVDYITQKYDFYPTGIDFIDDIIGGIETETVSLFCAPSNHGKSLLLFQLIRGIIETNLHKFNKNDVILHITLEDNRIKLSRRVFTIFGNISPQLVKQLFTDVNRIYNTLKNKYGEKSDIIYQYLNDVNNLFKEIEEIAINSVTNGNMLYMIQDQSDSSYTTTNLLKTLTSLKVKGYNVRAVFLDYVDLMTSSRKYEKEYDEHGQIIKDLRAVAKEFHIPIITVTQLSREAESYNIELSHKLIGDSYKKVRYSDYIFMFRQSPHLLNNITNYFRIPDTNQYNIDISQVLQDIIPVEYKFTKVKDTEKTIGENNLLLFNKKNLNFYSNLDQLVEDYHKILLTDNKVKSYINNSLSKWYNIAEGASS